MLLGTERLQRFTAIRDFGIIITTGIKVTFNSDTIKQTFFGPVTVFMPMQKRWTKSFTSFI